MAVHPDASALTPVRPAHRADGSGGRSLTTPEGAAGPLLAALALLSATAYAIGTFAGWAWLATTAATWLVVLGTGSAPWHGLSRLSPLQRWCVSALTGLAVLAIASTAASLLDLWHPQLLLAVVAVPACAVHVRVLAAGGADALCQRASLVLVRLSRRPGSGEPGGAEWVVAPLLAALGAALCLLTAAAHRGLDPSWFGYLRVIGPVWFAGLVLLLAAVVALRPETRIVGWAVVTLLTAVTTLTPAIVYDLPRSPTTGKHVALVEQVMDVGHVASSVAVYNAWPGFFTSAAWLCDLGGLEDPFDLARWWAAGLGFLRVLALARLVQASGAPSRWTWSAVAVAVLADPIGADYFSPQALAFVIALLVFSLFLQPLPSGTAQAAALLTGATAVSVSHQLTPYVVAGVAVLLAVSRVVRPVHALLVVTPALAWTGLHSSALNGFVSLADIGSLANFRPPQTRASAGLDRSEVITAASTALLVGVLVIGVLALRGLLARPRALRWFACAAAPAVGLVLVAVNPYGNEGIFRATLFGLPWLALLCARGLAATRRPLLLLAPALAVLTPTFLVASSALDTFNVIRAGDLQTLRSVESSALEHENPPVVLLTLGAGDLPGALPSSSGGAVHLIPDDIDLPVTESQQTSEAQAAALARALERHLSATPRTEAFAVWSPTSAQYDAAYGLQSVRQFEQLRDAMERSASWQVVSDLDGTVLFRLVRPGQPESSPVVPR